MRAAFFVVVASLVLWVPFVRAADVPRPTGWEVGAWRWIQGASDPFQGERPDAFVLSVGRWKRLTRAVTWVTRLEYGDLTDLGFRDFSLEHDDWSDLGHSVSLETGLALHPPVNVGVAPYVGVNAGVGLAHWGDRHNADFTGPGWVYTDMRHPGLVPAVVVGAEAGLRVFSKRGWPGVCAAFGIRLVAGPPGVGAATFEPVVSIGY